MGREVGKLFVKVDPRLARVIGHRNAAFIGLAVWWQGEAGGDAFWSKRAPEWREHGGFEPQEVRKSRDYLESLGLIEVERRGQGSPSGIRVCWGELDVVIDLVLNHEQGRKWGRQTSTERRSSKQPTSTERRSSKQPTSTERRTNLDGAANHLDGAAKLADMYLLPDVDDLDGVDEHPVDSDESTPTPLALFPVPAKATPDDFDRWWEVVKPKVGKVGARKQFPAAWKRAAKENPEDPTRLLIERRLDWEEIMTSPWGWGDPPTRIHPERWLSRDRWTIEELEGLEADRRERVERHEQRQSGRADPRTVFVDLPPRELSESVRRQRDHYRQLKAQEKASAARDQ